MTGVQFICKFLYDNPASTSRETRTALLWYKASQGSMLPFLRVGGVALAQGIEDAINRSWGLWYTNAPGYTPVCRDYGYWEEVGGVYSGGRRFVLTMLGEAKMKEIK